MRSVGGAMQDARGWFFSESNGHAAVAINDGFWVVIVARNSITCFDMNSTDVVLRVFIDDHKGIVHQGGAQHHVEHRFANDSARYINEVQIVHQMVHRAWRGCE